MFCIRGRVLFGGVNVLEKDFITVPSKHVDLVVQYVFIMLRNRTEFAPTMSVNMNKEYNMLH